MAAVFFKVELGDFVQFSVKNTTFYQQLLLTVALNRTNCRLHFLIYSSSSVAPLQIQVHRLVAFRLLSFLN
jgi:hypothetical protein